MEWAQLTVDTTIVSPLTAAGEARSRRDPARPVALEAQRRRGRWARREKVTQVRARPIKVAQARGGQGSEAAVPRSRRDLARPSVARDAQRPKERTYPKLLRPLPLGRPLVWREQLLRSPTTMPRTLPLHSESAAAQPKPSVPAAWPVVAGAEFERRVFQQGARQRLCRAPKATEGNLSPGSSKARAGRP